MATRLYDLDCASVGTSQQSAPGAEELVDFPQRTGKSRIASSASGTAGSSARLMFGEREAGVRRLGRALKKLIDSRLDVTSIKDELLDPAFDLGGWLNTHALTREARPGADRRRAAAAQAHAGRAGDAASPTCPR